MKRPEILAASDEKILEIMRAIRVGYGLKRTLRYSTTRDFTVHTESVAEHEWALTYLARFFLPLEDPEGKLDVAKIDTIITAHDMPEIIDGDKPYHTKTADDIAREHENATQVFGALPEPLGSTLRAAWEEYEERKTPEAEFVYALDKVEPCFELLDPVNEKSFQRLRFTHEQHLGKKLVATADFPVMRRFVEAIDHDFLKRRVFWEENP